MLNKTGMIPKIGNRANPSPLTIGRVVHIALGVLVADKAKAFP